MRLIAHAQMARRNHKKGGSEIQDVDALTLLFCVMQPSMFRWFDDARCLFQKIKHIKPNLAGETWACSADPGGLEMTSACRWHNGLHNGMRFCELKPTTLNIDLRGNQPFL